MIENKLLTPGDVSEILGVSVATLATWRATQRYDLPYIKTGRLVRYLLNDVQAFIDENRQEIPVYS